LPAFGATLEGVFCPPAAGEAESCPPAGWADPPPGSGEAAGSGEAEGAAPPPGFPKTGWSPPNGLPPFCRARSRGPAPPVFIAPPESEEPAPVPP
jgi:hypothetical protein